MKQIKTLLFSALAIIMLFGCQDSSNVEPKKKENMGEALELYIKDLKANGETNISEKIRTFLTQNYDVTFEDDSNISSNAKRNGCSSVTNVITDADGTTWKIKEFGSDCGYKSNCVQGFVWMPGDYFLSVYLIC